MTTFSQQARTKGSALLRASQEAAVWGAIFAVISGCVFVVAVAATLLFRVDFITVFATGYRYIPLTLVRRDLLHPENIGGALLVGHVLPWLCVGFFFGLTRGLLHRGPRSFACQQVVALVSLVVDGLIIAVSLLVLFWP